jgi:D-arabinitol dehydrogenase (NADP+)
MLLWQLLRVCSFPEKLLKSSLTCKVPGLKMELAKKLDSADVYVELSRTNPEAQFQKLKDENPYGFDIVIEVSKLRTPLADMLPSGD